MTVLVLAEHDNSQLKVDTRNTLNAALNIDSSIDVLVAGFNCTNVAETVSRLQGVRNVLVADDLMYADQLAEPVSSLLLNVLTGNYSHVLVSAGSYGKNVMPRVAAMLDVSQLSDIISVVSHNTFIRPIYAGNALERILSTDKIKVITVRTISFDAVGYGGNADIVKLEPVANQIRTTLISRELSKSDRPNLGEAKIIVSGGRGLRDAENFKHLIEPLADKLGAAIGASRAAVDAGFVQNERQVGQTGKIVSPELYIAIGISGAIQHLAGMKDSKVIVAINKDPQAMIFKVADYGLVADLFEVVPDLIERL